MLQVSAFAPHRTHRQFLCSFRISVTSDTSLNSRPGPNPTNIKGKTFCLQCILSPSFVLQSLHLNRLHLNWQTKQDLSPHRKTLLPQSLHSQMEVHMHAASWVQSLLESVICIPALLGQNHWSPFSWETWHCWASASAFGSVQFSNEMDPDGDVNIVTISISSAGTKI